MFLHRQKSLGSAAYCATIPISRRGTNNVMSSTSFAAFLSEFIVNQIKLCDCYAVERLAMGEDPIPALGAPLVAQMGGKRNTSAELHSTASALGTCIKVGSDYVSNIVLTALVGLLEHSQRRS